MAIVVPTLHPAFLLRSADGGSAKFKETVISDFEKALKLRHRKPNWDERAIWEKAADGRYINLFPTVEDVSNFCRAVWKTRITIDVETSGEEPLNSRLICVGIGSENGRVMCVPFLKQGGERYWTHGDEVRVRELLRFLFADRETPKNFHNGAFDTVILRINGLPTHDLLDPWENDTMAAKHVVDGELPNGLAFCASTRLEVPYWKDDVKGDVKWLDLPDIILRSYNCLPGEASVRLADGSLTPIKKLVQRRSTVEVQCLVDGRLATRKIVGWYRSRVLDQAWWAIQLAGSLRPLVTTPDHRVLTYTRGWVEASAVVADEYLVTNEAAFTPSQTQALIGTMLGDSSIVWSPAFRRRRFKAPSAAISGTHSGVVGEAYVRWKQRLLPFLQIAQRTKAGALVTEYRSTNLRQIQTLAPSTYDSAGARRLRVEALERSGAIGLAVWFMDDGCLQKGQLEKRFAHPGARGGRLIKPDTITIAACRYPREDIDGALIWFRARFGPVYAGKDKVFRFSRRATEAFVAFVGAAIVPELRYKLPRDLQAPPFDPALWECHGYGRIPVCDRVITSSAYAPNRSNKHARLSAETRYCIDVEEAHNFFTAQALVHNCRDVLSTDRLVAPLHRELAQHSLWELYQEEIHASAIMAGATLRGMEVDVERRDSTEIDNRQTLPIKDKAGNVTGSTPNPEYGRPMGLGPKLRLDRGAALHKLQSIAEWAGFNPRSQNHLRGFLFEKLKFPVVARTEKSGAPSTDKNAMVLLALHAQTPEQIGALEALIKFRKADKMLGTWVEGLPILGDGRLHPSWKLLTVTGRFASSPNCLDAETEVLTRDGWVLLPQLRRGVEVMQWEPPTDPDLPGTLSFVTPTNYTEIVSDEVVHLENEHIDLRMTPDHRCVLQFRSGAFETVSAIDVQEDRKLHNAGLYSGKGLPLSRDLLALIVANAEKQVFGAWILDLSAEQLVWFCEKILERGGENYYSSSDYQSASWVQTALALSGLRARMHSKVDNFQIDVTRRHYSWTTNAVKQVTPTHERFYCVEVPSSYLIVRRRQNVMITGNCQNWNAAIKRIFRAARGHKLVSIDLSQAELRVMAYLASDNLLLRMYAENLNVHTINACMLFQIKPPPGHDDMNPQTEAFLLLMCPELLGLDYTTFRVVPDKLRWKSFRTLAKNFVFGDNYGAEAQTLYEVIRAKRDPVTDDLLFKDVDLGMIEGLKLLWEKMHHWIPTWWKRITDQVVKQGYYRCPLSERIRWFRAGFKRNDILNTPIQGFVAARMNKAMIEISKYQRQTTGYDSMIVSQVHDALTSEAPESQVKLVQEIYDWTMNQPFDVPGLGTISLPADKSTVGVYMDEV